METHPSYRAMTAIAKKYPSHAGSLFQTYNDIALAQQWKDLEVVDLGDHCLRGAVRGRRPTFDNPDTILSVVPCSLAETVSLAFLQQAFSALSDPPEIYLAVNAEDSSIVYYKISAGIVKPQL